MRHVRIHGASVADLAAALRGVAAELEAGTRVVQARFDALDWDDEQARRSGEDLAASLDRLAQLAGTMWAQAQWLAALVSRVDELAGEAGASVRMDGRGAPAVGPVDAFARVSALPRMAGAPAGGGFRLLDSTRFAVVDFDWLTADPVQELQRPHHGHQPGDYLALLRVAQPMLQRVRAGKPLSTGDRACYDALFGVDPVRLERHRDGRIGITDGRHRLWAALASGLPIPVVVVDA